MDAKEKTPFQKFQELATALVNVPKEELKKVEKQRTRSRKHKKR